MNDEFYVKDGLQFDRITRILGYFDPPDLVKWKCKVGLKEANRIGNAAMKIGTQADEWIKADVLCQKAPKIKSDEVRNCIKAYQQWKKDFLVNDLTVAETVYDYPNLLAGTPDLWRTESCIDIKCSTVIRQSYWLQTAFYAARRTDIKFRAILRLDKHLGIYEYEVRPVCQEDIDVVYGLLKAYRYYNDKQSLTEREEDDDDNTTNSSDNGTDAEESLEEPKVSNNRTGGNW